MHKLRTSRTYMYIPIDPPAAAAAAYTTYPCQAALIADDGTEPGDADWHDATWIDGEAAMLIGPGGSGAIDYGDGEYFAFVKISAGPEQPVLPSGRVRIGLAAGG